MENGIKQLKLDLYSDRNSCHAFLANQFRVLLSSLAYILLTELRLRNLQKTSLAKASLFVDVPAYRAQKNPVLFIFPEIFIRFLQILKFMQ